MKNTKIKICLVKDGYVVGVNNIWLCGVYDSLEATIMAVKADDKKLENLWQENKPNALSFEQIQEIVD